MKYGLCLFLCLCCVATGMYAQESDKEIQRSNQEMLRSLSKERAALLKQAEALRDSVERYSSRHFSLRITDAALEKKLKDLNFNGIYERRAEFRKMLERAENPSSPLVVTYGRILTMLESLHQVYDKATNVSYKKLLKEMKPLKEHQAEFKVLSSAIQDYRFVMFELARVFKVIDEMKNMDAKSIARKLKDDGETEYITTQFPYAYETLQMYINHQAGENSVKQGDFEKTMKELIEACPEAFSGLKK